ncbi:MAG: hypothetical protein ACR2KW_06440, partial [Rubrobacter sp.]
EYFGVAEVGRDQVVEYAKRKDMTLAEIEKWLSPNLGYDPDDYEGRPEEEATVVPQAESKAAG